MNKEELIINLNKYKLYKKEFIILSGAALVFYGIKEYAKDIDIAVSDKIYKTLLKKYNCIFEKNINNYDVWYIDNIINFSINYYNEVDYEIIEGYKVQTLDSIIKLKEKLNRDKDKKDIKIIKKYINNN